MNESTASQSEREEEFEEPIRVREEHLIEDPFAPEEETEEKPSTREAPEPEASGEEAIEFETYEDSEEASGEEDEPAGEGYVHFDSDAARSQVDCQECGAVLDWAEGIESALCPNCNTVLYRESDGSISFYPPSEEVTLSLSPDGTDEITAGVSALVEALANELNFNSETAEQCRKAFQSTAAFIREKGYEGQEDSVYSLLLEGSESHMVFQFTDRGLSMDESVDLSELEKWSDEVRLKSNPEGGNLLYLLIENGGV